MYLKVDITHLLSEISRKRVQLATFFSLWLKINRNKYLRIVTAINLKQKRALCAVLNSAHELIFFLHGVRRGV